jgi:hypothetical protein
VLLICAILADFFVRPPKHLVEGLTEAGRAPRETTRMQGQWQPPPCFRIRGRVNVTEWKKNLMDEKKRRALEESRKRSLRAPITKIYISIGLCTEDTAFAKWIEETPSFPAMLRRVAQEHFGGREDVNLWERGICQILSDLAMSQMTAREKLERDILLPRDIVLWFADFLERTFAKPLMRWDSTLFSQESVQPVLNELTAQARSISGNGHTIRRGGWEPTPRNA